MVQEDQVVFVTGASQGAGAATARELAERGHRVVAAMRSPERDGPDVAAGYENQILAVECELGERASIDGAVAAGVERFGRIDSLVNNAGLLVFGAIEDLREHEIQLAMDINFTALIRTAQSVLPGMREQGSGKIINVCSSSGKQSGPLGGLYSASKHAVEAMSEALRFEVRRWGVQVIIVEPGEFKTRIHNVNRVMAEALQEGTSLYQEPAMAGMEQTVQRAGSRPGPRTLASTIADIVELEQPLPVRWPVGYDTHESFRLHEQLSDAEWEEVRLRDMHPFFRGEDG